LVIGHHCGSHERRNVRTVLSGGSGSNKFSACSESRLGSLQSLYCQSLGLFELGVLSWSSAPFILDNGPLSSGAMILHYAGSFAQTGSRSCLEHRGAMGLCSKRELLAFRQGWALPSSTHDAHKEQLFYSYHCCLRYVQSSEPKV
jgi:hypothetical protein